MRDDQILKTLKEFDLNFIDIKEDQVLDKFKKLYSNNNLLMKIKRYYAMAICIYLLLREKYIIPLSEIIKLNKNLNFKKLNIAYKKVAFFHKININSSVYDLIKRLNLSDFGIKNDSFDDLIEILKIAEEKGFVIQGRKPTALIGALLYYYAKKNKLKLKQDYIASKLNVSAVSLRTDYKYILKFVDNIVPKKRIIKRKSKSSKKSSKISENNIQDLNENL